MSTITHFIDEAIRNMEIDEFLEKRLDRAGFGGVEVARTPLGTRVIIYATRPGMVIGRRGSSIIELTRLLEERFKLQNPQIAVSEIEVPELNARVMCSRIADAMQRGIHFRRTGFWALNQIMRAGAMGAEIVIRGKLTSQRHRYEKYREGYIVRSGDPVLKNMRRAVTSVQLKQGLIGISIKIVPPGEIFPDRVRLTKIEVIEGEGEPAPGEEAAELAVKQTEPLASAPEEVKAPSQEGQEEEKKKEVGTADEDLKEGEE
jgi:small subunit ribosomal protein S3